MVRVSVSGPQVPLKVLVTLTVAVALPRTVNSTRAELARLTTWAVGDQAEYPTVSAPLLSVSWMMQYASGGRGVRSSEEKSGVLRCWARGGALTLVVASAQRGWGRGIGT